MFVLEIRGVSAVLVGVFSHLRVAFACAGGNGGGWQPKALCLFLRCLPGPGLAACLSS